ncbi:MAG TPA: hypothetical protein VF103_09675, partial [Polyangiaceae bacterium]
MLAILTRLLARDAATLAAVKTGAARPVARIAGSRQGHAHAVDATSSVATAAARLTHIDAAAERSAPTLDALLPEPAQATWG